ncbi:putative lipase [Aspergillus candidus]|uniref:Secretory lipase-domain-containing protein n=1 Tax=Aspergillus candidus TaxID=41067 RepID=A0A2I2FPP7_ASPCN|nr:secretory lipase-domain-containing protein [Aspergillus candidus]PLB42594.1 secretory lipase-domain-containing protein [Aspergillus candidus]
MLGTLSRAESQVFNIPELPSRDAFYTPDASDWADNKLGTILDYRQVNIDLSTTSSDIIDYDAFQLLYVTSDLNLQKTTSVTTIIIPQGANTSRILSHQLAYDAPDVNCSPSYGIQPGANAGALPFTRDLMGLISEILEDDHPPVLNIPDYEGSNAAFTVGPQSGYQTLDSLRAATASGWITSIEADAEIAVFGYSGGGYASEWAVELHRDYAEDVNIIGAALGGLPTNILTTYQNMIGLFSPLNVWAMLGMMNAFPHMNQWMEEDLKPERLEQFNGPRQRCSEPEVPPAPIQPNDDVNSWFEHGDYFLTKFEPEITEIGIMGRHISTATAPKYPLYIFRGGLDVLTSPHEDTVALKEKFCREGTSVTFVLWPFHTHVPASEAGSPYAMKWVRKVFEVAAYDPKLDYLFDGESDIIIAVLDIDC